MKDDPGDAPRELTSPRFPEGDGLSVPCHVAIIMDGNGRWAQERGLDRAQGHARGMEALRRVVRRAKTRGVRFLTLYTFSSENQGRPREEVHGLMDLLKSFVDRDLGRLHEEGVRVRVLGRRDDLQPSISSLLDRAERLTQDNEAMVLLVAFNYSAQDEILRAARSLVSDAISGDLRLEDIDKVCFASRLDTGDAPEPDVLVRTSGEKRLSNFLLWQCAYTEFVFVDTLWPDFDEQAFDDAITEFNQRNRRFGKSISEKGGGVGK